MSQNLNRFDGVERVVHNNYKRYINKVITVSNLNCSVDRLSALPRLKLEPVNKIG